MIGSPEVPIQPPEEEGLAMAICRINSQDMCVTIFPDWRAAGDALKVADKIIRLTATIEQIASPDVLQRLHISLAPDEPVYVAPTLPCEGREGNPVAQLLQTRPAPV